MQSFGHLCRKRMDGPYRTDKVKYADVYAELFDPMREQVTRLLEMGIAYGGSMLLWLEYFPNATICGIDAEVIPDLPRMDRLSMYHGKQEDRRFMQRIVDLHGPFDVVIDDAGHEPAAQLAAFSILYPYVRYNGVYVVEDIPGDARSLEEQWNLPNPLCHSYKWAAAQGSLEHVAIFRR